MRLSRPLIPISLSLAALALSACGGGGDETTAAPAAETTAAPSLSKEELISQGDAICAEVNAALGSVDSSAADTQTQATQTAGLYTGMVESIEELGTPDEPDGYSDFVAAAEELAKVEGEAKLAAEREDTAALEELSTEAALEEFQAQAAIYGFEDCSEGPSAVITPPSSGEAGGEEVEEGGLEVTPEVEAEVLPEEGAPEEPTPETGGAGGGVEEAPAPEGGETGGGSSGGVGPG